MQVSFFQITKWATNILHPHCTCLSHLHSLFGTHPNQWRINYNLNGKNHFSADRWVGRFKVGQYIMLHLAQSAWLAPLVRILSFFFNFFSSLGGVDPPEAGFYGTVRSGIFTTDFKKKRYLFSNPLLQQITRWYSTVHCTCHPR